MSCQETVLYCMWLRGTRWDKSCVLRLFLVYLTDVSRKKACRCGPSLHCDFRNCQWYMPVCLATETLSPNLLNNRYAYNKYCKNSNLGIHFTAFPTPHTRMLSVWGIDSQCFVANGSGVTAGVSRSSFVSINNLAVGHVIYCVVCLSHNILLKSLMPSLYCIQIWNVVFFVCRDLIHFQAKPTLWVL